MKPLQSELLNKFPEIIHGFGWQGVELKDMLPASAITFPTKQVHGDAIIPLEKAGSNLLEADAFITNQAHLVCAVRTADCVPLLMYDPKKRIATSVHAGWRGTAQNIAVKTLQKMTTQYGSKLEDVLVAIGPSICGTCYEVGPEVIQAMQKLGYANQSQTHLDVADVNRWSVTQAGVKPANIELINICTKCSEKPLASFRRNGSQSRQVSFIFLK